MGCLILLLARISVCSRNCCLDGRLSVLRRSTLSNVILCFLHGLLLFQPHIAIFASPKYRRQTATSRFSRHGRKRQWKSKVRFTAFCGNCWWPIMAGMKTGCCDKAHFTSAYVRYIFQAIRPTCLFLLLLLWAFSSYHSFLPLLFSDNMLSC